MFFNKPFYKNCNTHNPPIHPSHRSSQTIYIYIVYVYLTSSWKSVRHDMHTHTPDFPTLLRFRKNPKQPTITQTHTHTKTRPHNASIQCALCILQRRKNSCSAHQFSMWSESVCTYIRTYSVIVYFVKQTLMFGVYMWLKGEEVEGILTKKKGSCCFSRLSRTKKCGWRAGWDGTAGGRRWANCKFWSGNCGWHGFPAKCMARVSNKEMCQTAMLGSAWQTCIEHQEPAWAYMCICQRLYVCSTTYAKWRWCRGAFNIGVIVCLSSKCKSVVNASWWYCLYMASLNLKLTASNSNRRILENLFVIV